MLIIDLSYDMYFLFFVIRARARHRASCTRLLYHKHHMNAGESPICAKRSYSLSRPIQ